MERRLRIAIGNLQSGIEVTRGYWQYLTRGWMYRLPHGSTAIERAADFLREQCVEVAALCEIEGGSRRTRWVDQLTLLAQRSGLIHSAFYPTRVVGARVNQGNAVCAAFPTRAIRNHPLPGVGEPRFLSEAELLIDGIPVRLYVTHLSLERKIRTPQIHHIAETIVHTGQPVILAGDFNIAEEAELALFEESVLRKAVAGATFPSWRPRRSLDHLFFSEHFEVVRAYTYDRVLFSDHLPFVAEVRLKF